MKNLNLKLILSFYITFLIPFIYFANIALAYFFPRTISLSVSLSLLGLIFAIIGLILWIISFLNLGRSFGVLPQKQKRVTKGLYKHFKHPMYLGIFLTFLGLSLANASKPGLIFLIRTNLEDKKLTN